MVWKVGRHGLVCGVSMLTRSAGEAVAQSESYELEKLPATACLTVPPSPARYLIKNTHRSP